MNKLVNIFISHLLLLIKLRPLLVAEASSSCFYRLEGEEVEEVEEVGSEQEGATSIALLRILLLFDKP